MSINPATTYYFRVKSINLDGESPYSNTVSVTTLASLDAELGITPSPATTPTISQTEFKSVAIDINLALPFVNEYIKEIKLDISVNADYSAPLYSNLTYKIGENTQYYIDGENSYLTLRVGGLTPGTTYYGRLRFSNSVGLSGYGTFTGTTPTVLPAPELLGTTLLTAISARINWSKVLGATTYFVDVASNSNFSTLILSNVNAGDVSFRDVTALVEQTEYYYRVRASDGSIVSANSQSLKFKTLLNVETFNNQKYILSTPSFSSFTNLNTTGVELRWSSILKATTYTLEISTVSDFSSISQTITTSSNRYSVVGLSANTVYFARVRASNPIYDTTPNSTTQVFTTLSINTGLNSPQLLTPTLITSTSIYYQWVTRAYATRYLLEVSSVSNFASILFSTFTGNTSNYLVDTSLSPATTYYARIRGLNSTEASNFSSTVSASTTATLPTIVINSPTEIKSDSFRLNWTSNVVYSGYRLSVWNTLSGEFIGDGFFSPLDIGFGNDWLVDVFLQPNTSYSYMLTGYTIGGDSKDSTVQTVSTLKIAPIIQLSGDTLNWSGNVTVIEISKDKDFKFLYPGYPRTVADTGSFSLSIINEANNFYIRAYTANSEYSNTISSFKSTAYFLPPIVSKTTVKLRIKQSTSLDYKIQILNAGTPITGFLFPLSIGNVSGYLIENLTANTEYTARLSYLQENGNYSPLSVPITFNTNRFENSAEPTTAVLTAPVITELTTSFDRTSVSLAGGYSKYLIEVARDSSFTLNLEYYESTNTIFSYPLTPSGTYYIRAYGFNGTNRTLDASNVLTITAPAPAAFGASVSGTPTITGVNILDENQVEVTFSTVTNALEYKVEISRANTFAILDNTVKTIKLTTNKYLLTGLSGSLQYYLRVYGYNYNSVSSYSSTQLIDTTP